MKRKGLIGYEVVSGRLRLTIPAKYSHTGKQLRPSMGADTPENRLKLEKMVADFNWQITCGTFDSLLLLEPETKADGGIKTIGELWDSISMEGKKESTQYQYLGYASKIEPFRNHPITPETGLMIQKAMIADGTQTASRVYGCLKRAYDQASEMGKITGNNPFPDIKGKINVPKRADKITGVLPEFRAYTLEERDLILRHYRGKQHYPFIWFKFMTGCRTGEAIALTWDDIDFPKRKIYFTKTYSPSLRKTLNFSKNNKSRAFPMSDKMYCFLQEQRHHNLIVFPSLASNFLLAASINFAWGHKQHGIVYQLAKSGQLPCYLPCYHTRHTFINIALDAGIDSITIADWCDNSDNIIQQVYRSRRRDVNINMLP